MIYSFDFPFRSGAYLIRELYRYLQNLFGLEYLRRIPVYIERSLFSKMYIFVGIHADLICKLSGNTNFLAPMKELHIFGVSS